MTAEVFKPNEERRERIKVLRDFIGKQSDGAKLSWLEVEQATGISMGSRSGGRDLLREALARIDRAYLPLHGDGVELSSPQNGVVIVCESLRKSVRSLRRTRKKTDLVTERHLDQMSQENRNKMLRAQAILGTTELVRGLQKALKE